jgi:two-component system, cell cycle response regulator
MAMGGNEESFNKDGMFSDPLEPKRPEGTDSDCPGAGGQAAPSLDKKVLVVDDEPSLRRVLEGLLSRAGYEVFTACNGMEALRVLNDKGPQIVITDWEMPVMDGLQLCREIRQSETVGFVYAIILTSHTDRVVEAFDSGADDFLAKPPRRAELLARLKAAIRIIDLEGNLARQNREIHKVNAELTLLNRRLKEMATTDELTGLANRRIMMERLKQYWESSARRDLRLACMMLDIDHFKHFNDSFGHDVGDMVLREVAATLTRSARSSEPIYRCGGEEFVILCPDTTAEQAAVGAERLRKAIESMEVYSGDQMLKVTVSIGVADRRQSMKSADDLLRSADDALYQAKNDGRNVVRTAARESGDPTAPPDSGSEAIGLRGLT